MSKADEQVKTLNEQIVHMEGLISAFEQEQAGYRAACERAEETVSLLREELEDVQRENVRLRGWCDCAREILNSSRASTSNHELRVVK